MEYPIVKTVPLERQRCHEAVRCLENAAAANEAIGARPFAAHAMADHARVLMTRRAPGDLGHARDLLQGALAAFEHLGMTASARRVASLLAGDDESLHEMSPQW